MSGRVRVTLPDGRRVIGFRKTLRVQTHRTPRHLLPDWVLSFELPGMLGFGIPAGDYAGIVGVSIVGPQGHVEIRGKNHGWCYDQAAALLRALAPGGLMQPLNVRLTRSDEPGPTLSGPLRPGEDRVLQIAFDGKCARVIERNSMRTIEGDRRGRKASVWPTPGDSPPFQARRVSPP